MPEVLKHKTLLATVVLFIAASATTLAVFTVRQAGVSVPGLVAAQAFPVGVNIMKEQLVRIWSGFSARVGGDQEKS
jgi:hypothetical protein